MSSTTGNKENVSPQEMDVVCDHLQKGLSLNGVDEDGRYFLNKMEKESDRLSRSCLAWETEMKENSISEEGTWSHFVRV